MDKRLNTIYEEFQNHTITFNESVIKKMGLLPTDITLKCGELKLPCIIYSHPLVVLRFL